MHILETPAFATKPLLALAMNTWVIASDVRPAQSAADCCIGVGEIEVQMGNECALVATRRRLRLPGLPLNEVDGSGYFTSNSAIFLIKKRDRIG